MSDKAAPIGDAKASAATGEAKTHVAEGALASAPVLRAWIADSQGARPIAAEEAVRIAAAGGGPVWVDLDCTDAETAKRLLAPLAIHPVALEDLLMQVNRPKVDPYEQYLYLVVHSARWDRNHKASLREIDILISRNYLITYHEGATRSIDAAQAVLARRPELLARGPAPLLHFLLDVMVDGYLPIIDRVSAELDALEDSVFRANTPRLQSRILRLKRGMAALRRIVGPQRDTVLALTRDEFAAIPSELRPYLRDVYDRLARVSDLLDSYRDEITGLLDLYVSQVSQRLNQVMKTLTVISTVVLPLTLVVGYFGMNLKMRIFDWKYGEPAVFALIVLTAGSTLWYLRQRDWL